MGEAIDHAAAHRHFSGECFNQAWTLIEKPDRSAEDDEAMLRLAYASLYHWSQRADCEDRHFSVGYWQLARIHALLGLSEQARRYGQISLERGRGAGPFYVGYAHEALARAAMVAQDRAEMERHLGEARRLAEEVADPEEREILLKDLGTIG